MSWFGLVTVSDLNRAVATLNQRMAKMEGSLDALNAAVDQVAADLSTSVTELQTELDNLAAANPGVDLTAVTAKVEALDQQVQAVGNLTPTPPASQ
jgi:uncharacterized coiled-coil protein SlyX